MPDFVIHPARQCGKTLRTLSASRGDADGNPLAAAMEANARAMRQKIAIARKQLGMEEADYRALLARVCGGKTSSTQCGPSDLDALLREFRRLGWKPAPGKAGGGARRPPSPHAQVRMIHAVWRDLAPFVADPSEAGLRAFVRRQTGLDAPEFLDSRAANKVLEGLKAWLRRERAKAAAA